MCYTLPQIFKTFPASGRNKDVYSPLDFLALIVAFVAYKTMKTQLKRIYQMPKSYIDSSQDRIEPNMMVVYHQT